MREGRLIRVSESVATVELESPGAIPEQCNLIFTPDGKVGRRCELMRQSGRTIVLSIKGRIGPPPSDDSANDPSHFVKV